MKQTNALSSAAALAVGLWATTPAVANPAVLIFAPAAMGGVSAGWAAAAGLGGVLVGTALGAAAANNGWNGYGGYYHPGYAYPIYSYGGYTNDAPYGFGGYTAHAPYGYGDAAYDGPVYGAPAYGGPVYGQPYAAPAPVSHCYAVIDGSTAIACPSGFL